MKLCILIAFAQILLCKSENLQIVNQYIQNVHLSHVVKFVGYEQRKNKLGLVIQFRFNQNINLSYTEKKELIKLHNFGAGGSWHIYDDYKTYMHNQFMSYDILRFLVNYTIQHKDVYLFKAVLNNQIVYDGSGEYAQAYDEEATIPLLLNFPNIDYYLSNSDITNYGHILFFDWLEVNSGTLEDYKEMNQKIKIQSPRLAESLEMHLRGMILVMKYKITFDEFNKIIHDTKDIKKSTQIFTALLKKHNLLKELDKYHYSELVVNT